MRRLAAVLATAILIVPLGAQPVAAASHPQRSLTTPRSAVPVAATSLAFNPTVLDFGTVSPNSGPTIPLETVANFAGVQQGPTFFNFTIVGPDAADFYVTQNFCGRDSYACGIYVAFDPSTAPGPRTATLVIYDAATNSPQSVVLKGSVSVADLSLSATQLDLGGTLPNTTSAPQTLTITSTGTGPLNISQVTIGEVGTWVQFNLTQNCTGHPINPRDTCVVTVSFTPTLATIGFNTTLGIVSDAAGYRGVPLAGFGGAPFYGPGGTLDFHGLNVTQTRTLPVTITNLGSLDLVVTSDVIGGPDGDKFTIASDTCITAPIHRSGSCEIDVTAHATTTGTFSATLTTHDNSPPGSHDTSLAMRGVNVSETLSASSLDFGVVDPGQQVVRQLTITNAGPDPLSVFAISVSSTHAPDFNVSAYPCFPDIASGSTCTMDVIFYPYYPTGSVRTGTLKIEDSTGIHTIPLTATANGWAVGFSSDPLNFGAVSKGSPLTLSQTVTNTGNQSMTINPLSSSSQFAVSNDNCSNATLAPNATCTFSLTFNPCCMGDQSAFFYVGSGSSLAFFHIAAIGVAPSIQAIINNSFARTPWHTTSSPLTLTFKNVGTANWHVTSIVPADTTDFGVAAGTDNCSGTVVAPDATCTMGFTFSPSVARPIETQLNIVSDAPNFYPFYLQGVGTAPWAGFKPTLSYGPYEIGQSATQTIAVRNIQEAPLHVTDVTFSAPSAGFSLVSQTCQNVPRGGACQLIVQFAPTTTGALSSQMTLVDDEVSPQSVVMTGKGLVHAVCQGATLGAFPSGAAAVGKRVDFNASSSTCALPQYEFLLQPTGGSWSVVQPWSDASTWSWDTSREATGGYNVEVRVRDRFSDVSPPGDYESHATVTEALTTPPCASVSVTPDRISPAQIGSTISLTAQSDKCGTPRYEFWMLRPGSSTWVDAQPYSTSPTFMWNTAGMPAGTYRFSVWARDSNSAGLSHGALGSWDAYGSLTFVLTSFPTCNLLKGYVSPDFAYAGQYVSISAGSSYCPNPLYQFWLLAPGSSKWVVAQAYSSNFMFFWNTNGWVGGTYTVSIWAKDAGSPGLNRSALGSWDTYKTFSYYVQPTYCQSLATSADVLTPGKVRLHAYASGCNNPRYEFLVRYPRTTGYRLLRGYSTQTYLDFSFIGKPSGTYYFLIRARDASSRLSYDVAFLGYIRW